MREVLNNRKNKYVKPKREEKIFDFVAVCFMFALFILPQYFGIPLPVFDLTALRIMLIVVLFMIFLDRQRKDAFLNLIFNSRCLKVIVPYVLVLGYTMVLRIDPNAFLNPFIELFTFFVTVYLIKEVIGVERFIRIMVLFSYIIVILGCVEFAMGRSPFSYLVTIKGIYTGRFVRSGNYRIMSSCTHSLGYGLMLVTMVPFACLDMKENEVNLLYRPWLLILLGVNILLCGSRSTLSVFGVEIILLIFMCTKERKKKLIVVGTVLIAVFVAWLIAFRNTSIGQYILLQITSIIDELLGTKFSAEFGADFRALSSSSNYRDQLKYIFLLKWLNPLLGIGRKRAFAAEINGSYIHSVDSFYIAEYIRYAYPGLIFFAIFLGYFVVNMYRRSKEEKSGVTRVLLAGTVCYMINLLWVDSLQTLKYLYILFAVFVSLPESDKQKEKKGQSVRSKYIKNAYVTKNNCAIREKA